MAQRIEDYALIGDLRTAALVGRDGAIDWLPLPRFDSPAVFAALLGDARNGRWVLAPVHSEACSRRQYRNGTLILETDWTTSTGAARVTDLMVPDSAEPTVLRSVEGLVGTVSMHTVLTPRMGYGREIPSERALPTCTVMTTDTQAVTVRSDVALASDAGTYTAAFDVTAGQRVSFSVTHAAGSPAEPAPEADVEATVDATQAFWTDWVKRSTYVGPWAAEVNQSLVVLKALTYAPSGAILAAPTTSLPEQLGGTRNWDYRYSWLRDAAFAADAFLATGHFAEVTAWRDWLVRTLLENPASMQIMYAVDGAAQLPEQILEWLPGHAQSAPVRVGNAAATQQQNDVWGTVLGVLAAARVAGIPDAEDQGRLEAALLARVDACWQDPDHGLWEVRGPRRHFLHSKLMAWVGVDRSLRARERRAAHQHADSLVQLQVLRRMIADEITSFGYERRRRAFTQSYGSRRLDAAVLLMPRYGLISWDDRRMVDTVDAIQRELTDHGFVRRYAVGDRGPNVDGIPGTEGTFLAASFWLVDALHGMGRTREATELFQRLLKVRNDVGLLSEEYDPGSKLHLGNTPQAFSHAGLVTSAVGLSEAGASTVLEPETRNGFASASPGEVA